MTLPDERTNSLIATKLFLEALLRPKATPRVPRLIRHWAARCLRHYPYTMHIIQVTKCKNCKEIFGSER